MLDFLLPAGQHPGKRRGLKRKFFLTVVLPPLVPFLVLGFLGYSRLSELVRASHFNQLVRSAATTAAKIEREFSIRSTVLERTGEDIFALRAEYGEKRQTLDGQKNGCLKIVSKLPASSSPVNIKPNDEGPDSAIQDPKCAPFLSEFAKLNTNRDTDMRTAYTKAVNDGYNKLLPQINNEESGRINDRLRAYRQFFPETMEISVVASDKKTLVSTTAADKPLTEQDQDLVEKSLQSRFVSDVFETSSRFVVMAAPIKDSGSIMAALDTDHASFLKPSWESAPRPHKEDQVYIGDSKGKPAYPADSSEARLGILQKIANSEQSEIEIQSFEYEEGNEKMVARGSQIAGVKWSVMVASPESLLAGSLKTAENLALAAIFASLIVSLLVGLAFVTGAVNSIKRLMAGALTFAKGNLQHKINLKTNDELETLADTMNQMAAQIMAAQKALDEKNKEFISIATHELKAPMTAIIGNLDMLQSGDGGKIEPAGQELLDQAFKGTVRLRDLVSDLLDIARIEGGKAKFDIMPLDIAAEAKAIIDMQKVSAAEKKIQLLHEAPTKLPPVAADQAKLQIILTNFISNAIKYNRTGGKVTVSHQLKDGRVVTTIADNGLGIPPDQQTKMFQKFFRVEGSDRAGIPGTGLGMYITKQFIEAMQGQLWFESKAGQGTSFHFSLPVGAGDGATTAAKAPTTSKAQP